MKDYVQLKEEIASLSGINQRIRSINAKLREENEALKVEAGKLRLEKVIAMKKEDSKPFGKLKMLLLTREELTNFVIMCLMIVIFISIVTS